MIFVTFFKPIIIIIIYGYDLIIVKFIILALYKVVTKQNRRFYITSYRSTKRNATK